VTLRVCGRTLEPGSRFCPACGTPVESACSTCAVPLAPDARFCASCGMPVGAPTREVAAEARDTGRSRKVSTMVFADLVGFERRAGALLQEIRLPV